jgi:hypothetical protein
MNLASARRPKAPASRGSGTQFLKTAPSMKLFYSNPTGRSTLIFEYFSEILRCPYRNPVFTQAPSFAKAYSPLRLRIPDQPD